MSEETQGLRMLKGVITQTKVMRRVNIYTCEAKKTSL